MHAARTIVVAVGLLLGSAALALHQEPQTAPEITFETTELAAGLYMLEAVGGFGGGNIGLLVGEDGTILIDDTFPPFTETMLETVSEVTDQPIDYVINTHYHGDHAAGNTILGPAGALLMAHHNVRQRMAEEGIPVGPEETMPTPKEALQVITFSDEATVHLNGQTVRAFHIPEAHTDGDAAIHFEEANVIHMGDIFFHELFPFIDTDGGGSLDGYIAAQKLILELAGPETRIIPGHGRLATRQDLEASVAMLEKAQQRIGALVAAGKSLEEVIAARPLKEYEQWSWGFISTERMITQVFNALSRE